MKEQRSLIVGFDLSNDYSQISCYDMKTSQPESINYGSNSCLIPTVLFMKSETKEWFYGEEAITLSKDNKGILLDNIIAKIENKEQIEVMGMVVDWSELLVKFIRKSLGLIKTQYPSNSILRLVFTIRNLNICLIEAIYKASKELNLLKDRVSIQSHEESAIYYALSQSSELWVNDVGIFDFDSEGIKFYQISIQKKTRPYLTHVQEITFDNNINYEQVINNEELDKHDVEFENIAKEVLKKKIFTSIFLTGKGFSADWGCNTLKFLCAGRRVFKGQNLYTKGACYAAYELVKGDDNKFKEYIFISQGKLESSIVIKADVNNTEENIELVKAGEFWYNVNCSADFILKSGNTVELLMKNIITKDTIREIITLEGLLDRPKKTTRVGINISFSDGKKCIVNIKDKGFGDIFPTSNRVWEEIFII